MNLADKKPAHTQYHEACMLLEILSAVALVGLIGLLYGEGSALARIFNK